MWKSNPHSQKMYVNFWEVYILRAILASIINLDVKISTFFNLHIKNNHLDDGWTHLSSVALFTIDVEALLELCFSLPSVPVFIKCFWLLLHCSLVPSSLRQVYILLALSLSFISSLVSSTPISSLFKRKTTNSFPWHMQGRFPLLKTLGLRLHPSPWPGSRSGVQLSVYLQAFLKAHFLHQRSFSCRNLVPAVKIIKNCSNLCMWIIIIKAVEMICDKERNNKALWE